MIRKLINIILYNSIGIGLYKILVKPIPRCISFKQNRKNTKKKPVAWEIIDACMYKFNWKSYCLFNI